MTTYLNERFRQDLITFMNQQDPNGVWRDEDCRAEGMRPLRPEDAVPIVARWAAEEILADVTRGVLPRRVGCFADLHEHVDANGYGAAFAWPGPWPCNEPGEAYVSDHCRFWNAVHDRLDAWIRAGGIREHRLP